MRRSEPTIGSRLLLLAVAVALPFTILIVLEWLSDVDDARRSGDAAAKEQARELEVRIRIDDAQVFQRLEQLADDPAIPGAGPAECAAIFSRYEDLAGEHANLALIDAAGNIRCSVHPFRPGSSYAGSDWLLAVQKQRNATVFGPAKGGVLPGWVVVHVRPLLHNGQFAGALLVCRESLYYLRIARAIQVPPGGVVTIVNQQGVVIARSVEHEKWVGRPGIPLKFVSLSSATPITSLDGIRREYAAVRLPNGWLGGVGWPMSAVYGEVRGLLLRRGAMLLGSLLLVFFGGRRIVRSIERPITQLATESARFARAGETGALTIRDPGAPREVTELTATFNQVLTARAAAETTLQRQNAFLETLHETTLGLMNHQDLHDLLQTIAHQAAILADTEHTYIGLGDDERNMMKMVVCLGAMSVYQGWEVARGEGIIGRVWQSGQTMSVPDYEEYEGKVPDRPGMHALVCVPLRAGERVFGGLSLVHMERGRQFSDEQVAMLTRFAQLASIAIDNARLDGEARQELDQRRRAEEEVRRLNADLERRIHERTEELARANRDLEALNVELAGTARMKDEFLANMSHELRTPLNAVLGLSEVLDTEIYGPLNEKQRKGVRTIEESGRHLLDLINDILDLSKIEAGKLELSLAEVDIRAALESSMRMVREAAMRKNIAVELVCDLPVGRFQADERRVKQIVVNLLSNAVKFTPERGRVQLTARVSAGQLQIVVEDSGIGIPEDRMRHLFEPFVQLDSGHARMYGGTGLGLALVRSLTRLHGGSVDVASVVGEGSHFTVSLPLGLQQPEPAETAAEHPAGHACRSAVIVEDDADAADQMERYLRVLGLEDIRSSDAAAAVQTISEVRPCVVILDILLGTDTGWSILGKLKASAETRSIPVVVVSVVDDPNRGAAMGAAAYLIKPIRFAEFAGRLRHVLPHLRATPVRSPSAPRTILLADDNESNIAVVRDYLESRGYVIDVARDGLEAVEQAEAMRPDAVVMDVQMPLLDGLSATRRIRAIDALAHVPIIAVTALAMSGDREKCLAAGADEYLSKPVSLKSLGETIQRLLERPQD